MIYTIIILSFILIYLGFVAYVSYKKNKKNKKYVYIGARRDGKSSKLLKAAIKTDNAVIVVNSETMVSIMKNRLKELHIDPDKFIKKKPIITFWQLERALRGYHDKNLFIDQIDMFYNSKGSFNLAELKSRNINIVGYTATDWEKTKKIYPSLKNETNPYENKEWKKI